MWKILPDEDERAGYDGVYNRRVFLQEPSACPASSPAASSGSMPRKTSEVRTIW